MPAPLAPPFSAFAGEVRPQTPLRAAITAATRRAEEECLPPLIAAATLPPDQDAAAGALARRLVAALRAKRRGGIVEALVQEFSLSSAEGVALMCLAEALLRIPDAATRDALIRDKIGHGNWRSYPARASRLRQRGDLGADADRTTGGGRGRDRARRRARPPGRPRGGTSDPPRHGRRDAHDGRAVRHGRNHRRGAFSRTGAGGARLPSFLRHAGGGRGGGGGCGALPADL